MFPKTKLSCHFLSVQLLLAILPQMHLVNGGDIELGQTRWFEPNKPPLLSRMDTNTPSLKTALTFLP